MERTCQHCRKTFNARKADVDRGWARFCCKSCKAKDQERRADHRHPVDGRHDDGVFYNPFGFTPAHSQDGDL